MERYRTSYILFALSICTLFISGCHTGGVKQSGKADQGLINTGLTPIYPDNADCPKVVSFFGDRTRYDGSYRTKRHNDGFHGGMDISLPIGTPLIAIADGTVIQIAKGGMLVGRKIMLQHSPEDTGLSVWTYSKYQHLNKSPDLEVGDHVSMGQVIAVSGRTGTVGGHYGSKGYPHLHLNLYTSDSDRYRTREGRHMLKIKNSRYIDPLALYFDKGLNSHQILALPKAEKTFPVPYKDTDGKITPSSTKFVWPVQCSPRH